MKKKIGRDQNWMCEMAAIHRRSPSHRQMGKNEFSNVRHTHRKSKTKYITKQQKISFWLMPLSQPASQSLAFSQSVRRSTKLMEKLIERRDTLSERLWHRNNEYQITAIQIWSEKDDSVRIFIRQDTHAHTYTHMCPPFIRNSKS